MGKREPQIILKTDERAIRLELGREGNSRQNQAVGMKAGFSFTATSSSRSQERAPVLTNLPAGRG
jgi:hypothetical protein